MSLFTLHCWYLCLNHKRGVDQRLEGSWEDSREQKTLTLRDEHDVETTGWVVGKNSPPTASSPLWSDGLKGR